MIGIIVSRGSNGREGRLCYIVPQLAGAGFIRHLFISKIDDICGRSEKWPKKKRVKENRITVRKG